MSMRKTTKILFTASILLNIALLGALGGKVYKDAKRHPWKLVKEELSPESRNIVARNFRATHRQMWQTHKEGQALRKKMDKILKAEEFDEEAFRKNAEKIAKLKEKMNKARLDSMVDLAKTLPYEDRVKIADKMARAMKPRGPGEMRKRDSAARQKFWTPPQPHTVPVPKPDEKPEAE
jgi:uncharacterized membrane protein